MIRRLPVIAAVWLLLDVPTKAATPLDYTRTILEQVRTIVAGNQSHVVACSVAVCSTFR